MSTPEPMQECTIEVSWTMTHPSLEPKTWYHFVSQAALPQSDALQKATEKAFTWPEGTIAVLEQAFELHLSRSVGWQIDALSNRAPWIQAAQIFRRGVAYSKQEPALISGSYKIHFMSGNEAPELFVEDGPHLIDAKVAKAWKLKLRPQDLSLDLDENSKSLDTAAQIRNWIHEHSGVVTIVGGGILADVAAFTSALMNRPFRLIPTTLLAMLDACVGGKTGVNFGRFGKNQLGLFAFPLEVVITPAWLKTLNEREFNAGLAEGYKHAVIAGDKHLADIIAKMPFSVPSIEPYLSRLVAVKAQIISEDPSEAGKRAILNFGHTLAHALEKISHQFNAKDPILHGEAIGIGMLFALYLSHRIGHLNDHSYQEISEQIESSCFLLSAKKLRDHLGLDQLPEGSLLDLLAEGVMQDKKNQDSSSSEWVLLEEWGQFVRRGTLYTAPVGHEKFKKLCRSFLLESGLIDSRLALKL